MDSLKKWLKVNQKQKHFHIPFFLNFVEQIKKGDNSIMPNTYSVDFYNSTYWLRTLPKPVSKIINNKPVKNDQ
jgi:hypothetical protein